MGYRKKPLVVHLINNLQGGGAEKLLNDLVNETKDYYELIVVTLNKRNDQYSVQMASAVKIIHLSDKAKYSPFLIYRLLKLLLKLKPKIIHTHLFPTFYYAGILTGLLKTKYIYTEHNTSNKRRKIKLFYIIEKKIYSRYNKIVCVSNGVYNSLINYNKSLLIKEKTIVINNGVKLIKGIIPKKHQVKAVYKIGMLGRFSAQKDQMSLIKASKLINQKIEFHFFGEGKTLNHCKNESHKIIGHDFIFHGFVKNLDSSINSIDVAVLSSKWEGFGLAAIETMNYGIPTIGSNVEGLKEVIGDKNYLFNSGDEKGIANIINKLISNPTFYNDCSKHSLKQAVKFDFNKMIKNYKNLYDKMI